MSKKNTTISKDENQAKYHHLTKKDRIKIESLINQRDENGKKII